MSLRDQLVKEFGEEKAQELLSEWGREMRSRVKKPYSPFADPKYKEAILKKRLKRGQTKPKDQTATN